MNAVEQKDVFASTEERLLAVMPIPKLFVKFALPGVIGLLFLGVQSIIDGIVLGHFIGANALAGVNLVLPCYSFMVAIAIVMGIGAQTLIGISLGQADKKGANDAFTTAFVFLFGVALVLSIILFLFAGEIAFMLGANDILQPNAVEYIRALVPFFPIFSVMILGDYILKVTGHPLFAMMTFTSTVVLNIISDLLFVPVFGLGIAGAALSTGLAFTVGCICNLSLLVRPKSLLPLTAGKFRPRLIWQMFYNGSSEGMSELSAGITVFLFNLTMMAYLGEKGVAAFTATNYVLFIGTTIFLGISDGIIPIMSYNFGAGRYDRVKSTLWIAFKTNLIIGVVLCTTLFIGGEKIVSLFFKDGDAEVMRIAAYGTSVFAFAFLLNGLNILASSYFTSMGNAKISIIISLLRSLVFTGAGIIFFPRWFGIDGIWFDVPVAELCTLGVSFLLVRYSLKRFAATETIPFRNAA